jgi:hypothetical protein
VRRLMFTFLLFLCWLELLEHSVPKLENGITNLVEYVALR